MAVSSFIRLISLAAIWGASFLFTRIAVNPLGPAMLIEARVGFAALTLLLVSLYLKKNMRFRANLKHFFILGFFNSALPFLLFAYSAQVINASTLAIINSTAPLWGAVIGAIWTRTALTKSISIGLFLGICGVIVLVGFDASGLAMNAVMPLLAGLLASFSYGVASNYAKHAPQVPAFDNAHGSMWTSVIIVLPLLPFFPMKEAISVDVVSSVVLLGVVCTAIAYLLYFRLIADLGASSALSVTFLIPVFGIFWGHIFLDEAIGMNTLLGTTLVVSGTMFVTGFSPIKMLGKKVIYNG